MSGSVTTALQATGKIKIFQIGISILMLSELPMAYILLHLEYPPYSVMYPTLLTYTIAIFFRFFLIKSMVSCYSFRYYILHVLFPCMIVFVSSWIICNSISRCFDMNLISLVITSLLSIITILTIVFLFGINIEERKYIKSLLVKLKQKRE